MTYTIVISKSVQKQIKDLPSHIRERIIEKIKTLTNDPRPDGVVKLKNSDREYRVRVGNYRIRYEINDADLTIKLLQCKHRKDVYRK
jgi:mRNA interferase RelE/StbE